MRTIAVVTVGRSDWGLLLPIVQAIREEPSLRLHLIVSGAHLSPASGSTIRDIEASGFEADDRVEMALASDSPLAVAKSMGLATIGFADVYQRVMPDILLVIGDRFEMHAAAIAAVPFNLPIAHVHGGEVTQGAIDDALRHAITKYSHLHFVSTEEHARRVEQLGEEPWRVTVSGAPGLDHLHTMQLLGKAELERRLGLSLNVRPLIATFHPVTMQHEHAADQTRQFLSALAEVELPIVITKPNADTGNHPIHDQLAEFAARPNVAVVDNLGTQAYFSLMAQASVMVGNSSSGLIESASFRLPTVNVGIRQQGRARSANVIDADCTRQDILAAIEHVMSDGFRDGLEGMTNVYGSGRAAPLIVSRLRDEPLTDQLLIKRFHDVSFPIHRARAA